MKPHKVRKGAKEKGKKRKENSMLWRCFCGEAAYSWTALNGTLCCTQRFLSSFLSGFHVCCECKKTYRSRMALNRHVREECGRILYTCPFCHSIMPMKFNLLNHLKKEHGCVTKIWSDLISERIGSFLANDFFFFRIVSSYVNDKAATGWCNVREKKKKSNNAKRCAFVPRRINFVSV